MFSSNYTIKILSSLLTGCQHKQCGIIGTLSTSLCEEVKVLGDIICSVKLGRLRNQDYKETTISFCLNQSINQKKKKTEQTNKQGPITKSKHSTFQIHDNIDLLTLAKLIKKICSLVRFIPGSLDSSPFFATQF